MANKNLVLIGNAAPEYAKELGEGPYEPISASISKFKSGEPFTELFFGEQDKYHLNAEKLKGAHVVIVHSTDEPVSERCKQLEFALYRLKECGVAEITVAMPYASFDRQDREFPSRFACMAAKYFPEQLKNAGADRVIRITPHSRAATGFYEKTFGDNYIALSAAKLFAENIRKKFPDLSKVCIGAPDGADKPNDEGQHRAFELARELFGDLPDKELKKHMFFISKKHTGVNDTEITGFEGEVAGRHCVVVDDMIDGGGTMINASSRLKAKGALSVTDCATHGILSDTALERILSIKPDGTHTAVDSLIVTDSVPTVHQKVEQLRQQQPRLASKVEVLSTAPMIKQALQQLPELTKDKRRSGFERK